MRTRSAAALTAAGIVGSGLVGGLTYAAVSSPAAASSRATSAGAASTTASTAAVRPHMRGRRLLGRVEHGQLTLQTRAGERTIDLQRGAVTDVSASSLTVRNPDGVTDTYTVTSGTKVRARTGLTTISAVHDGSRVFVVAAKGQALRVLLMPIRR